MKQLKIIIVALFLISPFAANAAPITWTLNGVTFNDGSMATGSFVYDADTSTVSGVNIVTNVTTYDAYDVRLPFNFAGFAFMNTGNDLTYINGRPLLALRILSLLTNAGGSIDLFTFATGTTAPPGIYSNLSAEGICAGLSACDRMTNPINVVVAGSLSSNNSIVGVPEPGTLVLLGLGLAGMCMSRRKKV